MEQWLTIHTHNNICKQNRKQITYKSKSGYDLEVSMPALMKLLRSSKNEITKDKND